MSKHNVRCIKRCWLSDPPQRFNIGQTGDIESLDPIAMYFEGWPPGTEVYHKIKGGKNKPNEITTRIIPGAKPVMVEGGEEDVPVDPAPAAPVGKQGAETSSSTPDPEDPPDAANKELTCDICNVFVGKSEKSLKAHKRHCAERIADQLG